MRIIKSHEIKSTFNIPIVWWVSDVKQNGQNVTRVPPRHQPTVIKPYNTAIKTAIIFSHSKVPLRTRHLHPKQRLIQDFSRRGGRREWMAPVSVQNCCWPEASNFPVWQKLSVPTIRLETFGRLLLLLLGLNIFVELWRARNLRKLLALLGIL